MKTKYNYSVLSKTRFLQEIHKNYKPILTIIVLKKCASP